MPTNPHYLLDADDLADLVREARDTISRDDAETVAHWLRVCGVAEHVEAQSVEAAAREAARELFPFYTAHLLGLSPEGQRGMAFSRLGHLWAERERPRWTAYRDAGWAEVERLLAADAPAEQAAEEGQDGTG